MWYTMLKLRLLMMFAPFLGLILWQGIDSHAVYFDKSPDQVKTALNKTKIPIHFFNRESRAGKPRTPDENTLVSPVLTRGHEVMYFVTTIEADGEGSLVKTDVTFPENEFGERLKQRLARQPHMMMSVQKMAEEHVASAIEDREFDLLAMNPDPTAKLVARQAGLDATLPRNSIDNEALQEAIEKQRKRDSDYKADYKAEARSRNIDANFGKPMTYPGR